MTDEKGAMVWIRSLDEYEIAQRAQHAQPATIARRVKHLRRFAIATDRSPWHVVDTDVLAWLEQLDVADSTRLSMRDSLKSFYRWARATGRIDVDPTAAASTRSKLRLDVPPQWEVPIAGFRRYLLAKGMMPTTVRAYVERMEAFARENAGLEPFEVTLDDLFEWMAGKNWARETRRGRRNIVHSFYRWAVDTGRMEVDPSEKLPRVKAGEPTARPATDEEYQAALLHATPQLRIALRLAAEMGLRRAEVAGVHSRDLRLRDDGTYWLTVHGKGGKVRVLPVPASLAVTLRTQPPGYVFPGQIRDRHAHAGGEGHVSARYLGKQITALFPPGVSMHALRHRFATKAYNVNRDVFTLQKLMGHASPATTQRYVQVSDTTMRALVEAVTP
ncbi:tyrosine-type recombinase/integrase [Microbacterium mcarthurae (nom. nud.)]|uniref:Tyrosine-type recombinase/integrase n=1 Tax=Microbacterium mcarthurae TaxID=3035918 RepID=A0ABW9GIT1_9MICO